MEDCSEDRVGLIEKVTFKQRLEAEGVFTLWRAAEGWPR